MVGCVVNHEYRCLPPFWIDRIIVVAKLDQKQTKGATIVFTTINRVHQLAITAYCCYDAERSQSLHSSNHISLTRPAPAMLSLICLVKHTFVNVDYCFPLDHIFDVVGSSKWAL